MIEVQGLTKYYGANAAIRGLSFSIRSGEVIGFLGLNGAGKSTTLKVLGCVLLPTSGQVTIDGFDVTRDPHEIRKRIGFLPDTPPLYDEMTVGSYLDFVARLRGVPSRDVPARVAEAEDKTALGDAHDEVIGSLSHGFRQRVGLAQAIVHRPALLILDEPTSGLDPAQIVEMRGLIRNLRGEHTVLLSSHILSEISQTCDRLLVIHRGELIAQGSEDDLARSAGASNAIDLDVAAPPARALAVVRAVPGVERAEVVREEAGVTTLRLVAASALRPRVAKAVVGADLDLLRIDSAATQLESIFLHLTGPAPGSATRRDAA